MLALRTMTADDLPEVARWLSTPHVARWFLAGSSVERELDDLRGALDGTRGVRVLMVLESEVPIGWGQWYPGAVDPVWAADVGAGPDDVGIDYALGDPTRLGRGVGTLLVAMLVGAVRVACPRCAVFAGPDHRNVASRRVLEKNGFVLCDVRPLPSEPTDDPVAVYRLSRAGTGPAPPPGC